jgi:NADH-quinone oxidoreductase subunit K
MEGVAFNYFLFFGSLFGPFTGLFLAFIGMSVIKNPIRVLICIEVMFLCLSFVLVFLSFILTSATTLQIFALFLLAVAACETALVLSLIILFFRSRGLTNFDDLCSLKG